MDFGPRVYQLFADQQDFTAMEAQSMTAGPAIATTFRWRRFLVVAGPGLVVMLADTDAGSIITAAQSGAQWGYRLLALQFLLVPILYIVQELTVRLGAATGKGHARLILERYGRFWAWFSTGTLIVSCIGALLSEFSGIAGVGALMGVPAPVSLTLVVSVLLAIAFTRSYRSVERIALFVGAFELVFLLVAWLAHPSLSEIATGIVSVPLGDPKYLYLASANIGAVIMPWMVFFQQSSIVEKKLKAADIRAERIDTAIGAVVTQIIMAAVLIATAATLGKSGGGQALDTVQDISAAITPFLGRIGGNLLFGLGIAGAALVATIVVTLAAARTLGEVLGVNHSLDHELSEAPWFYGAYAAALIGGALVVASGVNLVALSVGVQVMNALLLPIVLGFLYLLARGLPDPWRLKGWYAWFSGGLIAVTTIFGVFSGLAGLSG
jgi:NRAMP (natural resistance-associated macrophage protein)-like metal ion transporter